jgi:hypothetical protein
LQWQICTNRAIDGGKRNPIKIFSDENIGC